MHVLLTSLRVRRAMSLRSNESVSSQLRSITSTGYASHLTDVRRNVISSSRLSAETTRYTRFGYVIGSVLPELPHIMVKLSLGALSPPSVCLLGQLSTTIRRILVRDNYPFTAH